MVSDVKELNFTAQPFFIQRADINIVDNSNNSQRVMATIRFAQPDSFLISVRVFAGIEVARILLTSDTVLINDRLNRTFYFGSNENVKRIFGFDLMLFPIILGDLITETQTLSQINCDNENAVLRDFRRNYVINYFINCANRKSKRVIVETGFMSDNIAIEFDDFNSDGKMIFPKQIRINNFANFAFLEMKIDKVEFGTGMSIDFIPGRNFDRVEIK